MNVPDRIYDPPFLNDPEFRQWLETVEAETQRIVEALKNNLPLPALKENIWQSFKKRFLLRVNKGRCAYCEGIYIAGAFADAEHYAPKGKVTEDRNDVDHPGYYWLAYQWENLLLSCKKCNSKHHDLDNACSHPGKLNEFPVIKQRAKSPSLDTTEWWTALLAEGPQLFHPYYDNPNEHFEARKKGHLRGKTAKGRATIDICHLNRAELREDRETSEESAHGRVTRIISLIGLSVEPEAEWFGMDEEFSTYLNCVMRERLLEKAKKIETLANQ